MRAAMVGGGAYAAGKHRERSQAAAQEEQQPAPAGGLSDAAVAQLEKLGQLRDQGILTPAEFDAQKQALLGGA